MTTVVNRSDGCLGLPMGGPRLRPGVPAFVERWDAIKEHEIVKAWISAKALEVVVERHPLDHDANGRAGGSLPADERGLGDLRAEYTKAFGVAPDRRWGEKRLSDAIATKG